jgi:hypothetical protein
MTKVRTYPKTRVPLERRKLEPPRGYMTVSTGQRTYWAPQPGMTIEGLLADTVQDKDPNGKDRTRWVLETFDGQHIVLPDHYDLQQRLARCKIGDRVWIGYEGREKVKGVPSPMHRYQVAVWTPEADR